MKYQRLVSNTTPSSLQEWLGQELEDRGIDSVYARSILSLLQQDYVDIEPHECQHARGRQMKVLHKHVGPEKSFSATKSKHQKWKTREMQILLTSTYPCCSAILPDLETLKKKAAVDCLQSASDYINHIEELIDEVWIKLKNVKNLKEKEDRVLREIMDPFFIPPSSPTDEIEKYFAAFPPLNAKSEIETGEDQHKISKSVWCKRCDMKRKSDAENEITHTPDNPNLRSSSKCTQPIIPYSSLKTIKNVYKNEDIISEGINKHNEICSFIKLNINVCKENFCAAKKITASEIISWKMKRPIAKSLQLRFENLSFVTISQFIMKKVPFLEYLQNSSFQNLASIFNNEAFANVSLKFKANMNFNLHYSKNEGILYDARENQYVDAMLSYQEDLSDHDVFRCGVNSITSPTCFASVGLYNEDLNQPPSGGLSNHFKSYPLSFTEDPHIATKNHLSFLSPDDYFDSLIYSFSENKNILDFYKETVASDSYSEEDYPFIKGFNYDKQGDIEVFPLPENNLMQGLNRKYFELSGFDAENSEEIYGLTSLNNLPHHEEENGFSETVKSNHVGISFSDEEIFYSDDDSNEIFHSDEEENLFTSSKTHFQPIKLSSLQSSDVNNDVYSHKRETDLLTYKNTHQPHFKTDSEKDSVLENEKIFPSCNNNESKKLLNIALCIDRVVIPETVGIKTSSSSSSLEELSSLSQFKFEKLCDKSIAFEQKREYENFPKLADKETSTEKLTENFSSLPISNQAENVFSSDKLTNSGCSVEDNIEGCNKKWLFHWGDNHNFISRTWQKDNFVPILEVPKGEKAMCCSEVITALSKEIKEEGEELLKGLCSMSVIHNDIVSSIKHERSESVEDYLHSSYMDLCSQSENFVNSAEEEMFEVEKKVSDDQSSITQINSKNSTPLLDTSFTLDNIKNNTSDNQIFNKNHDYNLCSSFYELENCPDISTIQGLVESVCSRKKSSYMEGGGWSLASDNFPDDECEDIYQRASSLGDLDLEKSEDSYFELYRQKRFRCASETETNDTILNQQGSKLAQNLLQKRTKQKYAPRKRPCCFFLQGSCTRSDCRFSHDLSTTTCRFWKEGSCFKGMTCPFLHGYIREIDQEMHKHDQCLKKKDIDHSYSLESETDFPSLSSVKP